MLLAAFVRAVLQAWPETIGEIRLFGSRARGAGHGESDLDVAVIFTGASSREVSRRLVDIAESAHEAEEGLPWLRPLALFPRDERIRPPLARSLEEGIVLWTSD